MIAIETWNQEEKIMEIEKDLTTKDPLLYVRFSRGWLVQSMNSENYFSELGKMIQW